MWMLLLAIGCAPSPPPQRDNRQASTVAQGVVPISPSITQPALTPSALPSTTATSITATPVPPVVVAAESSAAVTKIGTVETAVIDTPTPRMTPTVPVAAMMVTPPPTMLPILPSPTLPVLDEQERAVRFDTVWQTVEDNYLYRDFGGLDWAAIRDEYRSQALNAPSSEAFYAVVKAMIQRLQDRHSRYLTPQEAQQQKAVTGGTEAAYVGIGTLDTAGLVLGVFEGSPAEQAGLRRRDRIVAINDLPFGTPGASLDGPEGSLVRLQVETPGRGTRELVVQRNAIVTKLVPDAYRLPGTNTGYLAVQWLWSEDMGTEVAAALRGLLDVGPLDGLIIDLRANRGGWRTVLEQTLASFVEGVTGEFFRSDAQYPLAVTPNDVYARLATTPIVVLVDGDTQSYAEVLAAALQARGRAQVVGTTTPGNTETIFGHDFDDGSRLWLAQEGFRLPSGENLEGRGVIPDAVVDVDWTMFSDSDDPQIVKALELLALAREKR